jgi:hypothetical protein
MLNTAGADPALAKDFNSNVSKGEDKNSAFLNSVEAAAPRIVPAMPERTPK